MGRSPRHGLPPLAPRRHLPINGEEPARHGRAATFLQRPFLDSDSGIPASYPRRALTEAESPYPVSALVARFVDRLASLSTDEWASIQTTINKGGVDLSMLDASRNAAVALAVRDLISKAQFDQLYRPFHMVIPLESLAAPSNLD